MIGELRTEPGHFRAAANARSSASANGSTKWNKDGNHDAALARLQREGHTGLRTGVDRQRRSRRLRKSVQARARVTAMTP